MAKTDQTGTRLSSVDLFEGLSPRDLRRIWDAGKEIDFAPGHELTVEGSPGGPFFLILEGEVEIVLNGKALATMGPGEYLGEISLVDGEPRAASATARTPVHTWSLASFAFRPIFREYPEMAERVMLLLCRRLRQAEAVHGFESRTP